MSRELESACAQVWRHLDPASTDCLLHQLERAATVEGKFQRRLIAVARRLTLEARRKTVLPASPTRLVQPADDGTCGVLRLEWQVFGAAVQQLHRVLNREPAG